MILFVKNKQNSFVNFWSLFDVERVIQLSFFHKLFLVLILQLFVFVFISKMEKINMQDWV